jgi:hypothetical protein
MPALGAIAMYLKPIELCVIAVRKTAPLIPLHVLDVPDERSTGIDAALSGSFNKAGDESAGIHSGFLERFPETAKALQIAQYEVGSTSQPVPLLCALVALKRWRKDAGSEDRLPTTVRGRPHSEGA